jgi:hypothetical protein
VCAQSAPSALPRRKLRLTNHVHVDLNDGRVALANGWCGYDKGGSRCLHPSPARPALRCHNVPTAKLPSAKRDPL